MANSTAIFCILLEIVAHVVEACFVATTVAADGVSVFAVERSPA